MPNTENLDKRCERAFRRFFPEAGKSLTATHRPNAVVRITDDVTGRWAEYTYESWRIRRIDQGERT